MLLATTIDYNDNAAVYEGPEDYFPLEKYEEEIKTLAENGIKKDRSPERSFLVLIFLLVPSVDNLSV